LIDRVLGDSIEVKAPGGSKYYEIVKVDYKQAIPPDAPTKQKAAPS